MRKLIAFSLLVAAIFGMSMLGAPRHAKAQKGPPPVLENTVWLDTETTKDVDHSYCTYIKYGPGDEIYYIQAIVDWSTAEDTKNAKIYCEAWHENDEVWVQLVTPPQSATFIEPAPNTVGTNTLFWRDVDLTSSFGQSIQEDGIVYLRTRMVSSSGQLIVSDEKWVTVTYP